MLIDTEKVTKLSSGVIIKSSIKAALSYDLAGKVIN